MDKSKLVIHCASGIENSGDEAILEVMLNRYAEQYEITVLSLNSQNTTARHGHFPAYFINQNDPNALNAIDACDIFILGGGGLLQDKTSVFNVYRWLSKLNYAIKHRKITCLYANSIGELAHPFTRKAVSKILKKVDLITLRDEQSAQLLLELGISNNVHVTADPVFSWKFPPEKNVNNNYAKRYICFCIRHWYDTSPLIPVSIATKLNYRSAKNKRHYERYISTLAAVTNKINNELDISVVFLSMCHLRDTKVAKDVLNLVDDKKRNSIIDKKFLPVSEAVNIIRQSVITIGMRLHSLIYAMITDTPSVAIIYQAKVAGLTESADIPKFHVDTMKASDIVNAIKLTLANSVTQKPLYGFFVNNMQAKEKKNIVLLEQYLDRGY